MQYQGQIENWNDERGFGFVTPNGGGTRAFVHIKAFSDRRLRPVDGDSIVYEVELDAENRARAVNVRFQDTNTIANDTVRSEKARSLGIGGFIGVSFACLLAVLCLLKITPLWIPILYLMMSLITVIVYAEDKAAAQSNSWRTREDTLQALAFCCGWPGALFAQKMFRHKTRKVEFQFGLWFVVFLNCGVFVWTLTEHGSQTLDSFTGKLNENRAHSEKKSDEQLPRIQPFAGSPSAARLPSEEKSQQLPLIRPLPKIPGP